MVVRGAKLRRGRSNQEIALSFALALEQSGFGRHHTVDLKIKRLAVAFSIHDVEPIILMPAICDQKLVLGAQAEHPDQAIFFTDGDDRECSLRSFAITGPD